MDVSTLLTYAAAAAILAFLLFCAAYVVTMVVYAADLFYRWVTKKHPW